MGYDELECLICYCNGYGNNPVDDDKTEHVCMICIAKITKNCTSTRVASALKNCVVDTCDLCNRLNVMGFRVTSCGDHEKPDVTLEDDDEDDDAEIPAAAPTNVLSHIDVFVPVDILMEKSKTKTDNDQ